MKSKALVILLTIAGTICVFGLIVLVVVALGFGVYQYKKNNDVTLDEDDVVQNSDEEDSDVDGSIPNPPVEEDVVDVSGGTIEGSVSYPSEFIPEDLTICATNTQTSIDVCTSDIIQDVRFMYGLGYSLEVPAGDYHVYAYVPGDVYNAYYSEFVTCGLSVECTSHTPIVVSVDNGDLVENIDPGDWYAP